MGSMIHYAAAAALAVGGVALSNGCDKNKSDGDMTRSDRGSMNDSARTAGGARLSRRTE